MAVKSFKPNLQGADLEKIKAVCYPCTSQNDCSRRLNNEQATVERCNVAYNLFDIDPPPARTIQLACEVTGSTRTACSASASM